MKKKCASTGSRSQKSSKTGKRNRDKGASFERDIANLLRTLGLISTKTSRQASRLYDDCKIDHWGAILPNGRILLTQCKSGYKNNRPKADVEFKMQKQKIKENFPPGAPENAPDVLQILFHKIDNYAPENNLVTIKLIDFLPLLEAYIKGS